MKIWAFLSASTETPRPARYILVTYVIPNAKGGGISLPNLGFLACVRNDNTLRRIFCHANTCRHLRFQTLPHAFRK